MKLTLRLLPAALFATLTLAGCGDPDAPTPTPEASPKIDTAPLASAPSPITDQAEAQRIAHDRQERFEELGKAFKAINDELKRPSTNMAAIRDSSAVLVRYGPRIPSWFPAGTGPQDGVETDARAAIWREPEAFRKAAAALPPAAAELEAAAASGEQARVRAAVRSAGQACKNCHDQFREEDS